jgi:hypothetical protein
MWNQRAFEQRRKGKKLNRWGGGLRNQYSKHATQNPGKRNKLNTCKEEGKI